MTIDEARKAAPDNRPEDRPRKCPPVPPSTEYAPRRPPEPPKPRCVAEERNPALESAKQITTYMKWFSAVAGILLIANLYTADKISDMKIDPSRTDHAVQAGIRECERSLPRTKTCELSQLSFKVVEKKGW